jgi:cytochrome c553
MWIQTATAFAAGDAAAGKTKAASCGACHGPDGNSTNPTWPKLAGQHSAYLIKQLKAFKSGEREDPLMSPMAAALSEKDMEDLAAFFAGQKPK